MTVEPFWCASTVVLGLVAGSFIGLTTYRWPLGRRVVWTRSACESCGRALSPLELVPVLSWLVLRGRCRTCVSPIGFRAPLLEIGCAAIGLWAQAVSPGAEGLLTALLGWTLVCLSVLDAEAYWLPNALTLPLAVSGFIAAAGLSLDIGDRIIGAAAGWLSLELVARSYRSLRGREGLGGGDAKLFAAAGAWIGWQGLPIVLLIGSVTGLCFVLMRALAERRHVSKTERIPFGVFLSIGFWLTWLYG